MRDFILFFIRETSWRPLRNGVLLLLVWSLSLPFVQAQELPARDPFQGFHLGLTGQLEFLRPRTYHAISGPDPAPESLWGNGWEAGLEFSYHFARYFGVSLGVHAGTVYSNRAKIFQGVFPNGQGGMDTLNTYDPLLEHSSRWNAVIFPVKLEFHYPLSRSFHIMAEAGVKIKGVASRLRSRREGEGLYHGSYGPYIPSMEADYYEESGRWNPWEIHCDLLLGAGLYYRLPYGDLLRFAAGANLAFKNTLEGDYSYALTGSHGTFSEKNDFLYMQLAYIHTFNWKYFRMTEAERRDRPYQAFDRQGKTHSLGVWVGGSFFSHGRFKETRSPLSLKYAFSSKPEIGLKYSCAIRNGWGITTELSYGSFSQTLRNDLGETDIPVDTLWENGVVGPGRPESRSLAIPYLGISLKAAHWVPVHRNISLQSELGLRWQAPLLFSISQWKRNHTVSFHISDGTMRDRLPYMDCIPEITAATYLLPDIAFAFNVLVHGKNPSHNFVFGLRGYIGLSDRFRFRYQTTEVLPDRLQSSGEFGWRTASFYFHIGYQWMFGKKTEWEAKR